MTFSLRGNDETQAYNRTRWPTEPGAPLALSDGIATNLWGSGFWYCPCSPLQVGDGQPRNCSNGTRRTVRLRSETGGSSTLGGNRRRSRPHREKERTRRPRSEAARRALLPRPRPQARFEALKTERREPAGPHCIGAGGKDRNRLAEWTFLGAETDYDAREADGQP